MKKPSKSTSLLRRDWDMIENTEKKERVLLVAVAGNTAANDIETVQESLAELAELVKTAGAETVGQVIQNREAVHAGTYIGKGKIDEVAELLAETGADGILTDDELSPAQMKNLEDALGCKVMDRTMLILDIFAKHASTKEGTIQVELAQLKYRAKADRSRIRDVETRRRNRYERSR